MKVIETPRLILRTFEGKDAEPFYHINQDEKVLEFLPMAMTREQVNEFIERSQKSFTEHKFCLFAVELKETNELAGFVGLSIPRFEAHFTPAVEIGWRLGSKFWGKGYATEAAKSVLKYGFAVCDLPEIVSFTVPANKRSIAVMERIGLSRDASGDFAHPNLPADDPLSLHVLYRKKREL